MKTTQFIVLMILAFAGCTKKESNPVTTGGINNDVAVGVDTIRGPLTDLGPGTYMGFTGGLYPGGTNYPTLQYKRI